MGMSNNFLSQEEINALLSGESTDSEDSNVSSSASENWKMQLLKQIKIY